MADEDNEMVAEVEEEEVEEEVEEVEEEVELSVLYALKEVRCPGG